MGNIFSLCLNSPDDGLYMKIPLASNDVHEDYDFDEESNILGKGAYGTVVKGEDNREGGVYAIKIQEKANMDPQDEEDLKLEVQILRTLNHKYVMTMRGYYETPKAHYIVTELLEGGELFDRICKKEHYTEKEAKDVMYIFFQAMEYVHKNKVVHRDLKPENLLLMSQSDDEHLKIADFGLAGMIKNNEQLYDICGTPLYMSPEMIMEKPYSFSTDVWSMGVICFILIGGYPPFNAEDGTMDTLLANIKKGKFEFLPNYWGHVSETAKDLIRKMLEMDPDKRITIKEAMKHEFITSSDEYLLSHPLEVNHKEFKKFNAKRKFKAATTAIMTMNTLKHKLHIDDIKNHNQN